MLRPYQLAVSWVLVNLLLSTAASAQENRTLTESYPWWNIRAGLIGYKQVKEELKLTDDQMREIGEVADRHGKEVLRKLEALDRTRRRESAKIIRESIEHVRRFKWNDYLTPEQAVRFRQIQLWLMSHKAFNEPDVVEELELTEPQRNALQTIDGEFSNALNELTRNDRSFGVLEEGKEKEAVAEERKQLIELVATKEKECRAALTEEQNSRFDKLRGPSFDPIFRMVLGEMILERGP